MKKSPKTLLTAAMFAAAINASAYEDAATIANAHSLTKSDNGSAYSLENIDFDLSAEDIQDVYGPPVYYETTTAPEEEIITTTTTKAYNPAATTPVTVYGPPITTSPTTLPEDDTTTTTTTLSEEYDPVITTAVVPVYGPPDVSVTTTYDPSVTTPATVYGPPVTTTATPYYPEYELPEPTYGPPIRLGDANGDGNINSLDAVAFRKAIVNGYPKTAYMFKAYDINMDGFIDEKDLKQVIGYIKGEIEDIQDEYDSEYDEPDILYGPPEYFE